MAHPLNDVFNRLENRKPVPCNDGCEYWQFPHLPCACVLSEVFSVNKEELCFEFTPKKETP